MVDELEEPHVDVGAARGEPANAVRVASSRRDVELAIQSLVPRETLQAHGTAVALLEAVRVQDTFQVPVHERGIGARVDFTPVDFAPFAAHRANSHLIALLQERSKVNRNDVNLLNVM